MLKILIKKQFTEVFRSYFFNAKTNQMRSAKSIAGMFILFGVLMIGVLGGTMASVAAALSFSLSVNGYGWMYFLFMTGLAIVLGAFGSIFNTFTALYLSKDNDLLLSMPIPIKDIIISRLLNVYIMGAMYSMVVYIPSLIIHWIIMGITWQNCICGIVLGIIITFIVMVLSCLLGWCVAKISLKLKNKSFIRVIAALLFVAIYYFVYFKIQDLINDIILYAENVQEKIKGGAYIIYLLGKAGEGDLTAALIWLAIAAAALFITWLILKKTFLSIATSSGNSGRVKEKNQEIKGKSLFGAMLSKELSRFTSSPTYMLNSGFGIIMLPILGIVMLIKGPAALAVLDNILVRYSGCSAVFLTAALWMLVSMIETAVPSVSLEGKNIWIYRSMPIPTCKILRVKTIMQIILSAVPALFTSICFAFILSGGIFVKIMVCVTSLVYVVFLSLFFSIIGVKHANIRWTNETIPIKQSASAVISIFAGWGFAVAFAVSYLLLGLFMGPVAFMALWTVILLGISIPMQKWLDKRGSQIFEKLN